jgi:hypothetical protein
MARPIRGDTHRVRAYDEGPEWLAALGLVPAMGLR